MATADHYVMQQQKKRALREFDHRLRMLLTDADREYVYNVLKEFKMIRDADKLVACMRSVLDTPAKLDILKDIRNFVPSAQLIHYDRVAPYKKMAHPWTNAHMTPKGNNRKYQMLVTPQHTPKSTPKMRPKIQVYDGGSQEYLALNDDSFDQVDGTPLRHLVHSITVIKDRQEHLGFSIRGGSEHGLGIYVSEIEADSAADKAGLEVGDNIVEVNTIRFDSIASSSAVKVLTGSNRLKMTIKRVGKIPGFRSAKAKISWYDVTEKKIVDGNTIDHQRVHDNPTGLGFVDSVERRINLAVSSRDGQVLGFNIRGGSEFGLGIYVSKVDADGLAEQQGLKMGDQITHCNGETFEGLSHAEAVELMKSQKQLVLTVRDSGRFPAYKEIYAEYQWINAYNGTITRTRPVGQIDSIPVRPPSPEGVRRGMFTEFPTESRVEAFAQTDDEADDSIMIETVGQLHSSFDAGVQTDLKRHISQDDEERYLDDEFEPSSPKILVPHVSDIIMSQRPQEMATSSKERKDKKKDRTPKSTLAVRAMEMETRKKHPELAQELQRLAAQEQNGENSGRSGETLSDKGSRKSKSSLRGLFFGNKSKESKGKSSSHGASIVKGRSRAPLSSLNFESNSLSWNEDNSSAFASGVGSQLSHKDAVNSSIHSTIEERAKRLVSRDESAAVMRHIQRYDRDRRVNSMVTPLLSILDSPDKRALFTDIRSLVQPGDLDTYDSMVSETNDEGETSIELTSFKPLNDTNNEGFPQDVELNGQPVKAGYAIEIEPIKDMSSKEQRYSRINSDGGPSSVSNTLERKQQRISKTDGKNEYTMKRAHGQTKVYKAVVDIDFGEGSVTRPSPPSSVYSSSISSERVVVAQVESQAAQPGGYSDNLYVATSGHETHGLARYGGPVSPTASSIVSSVAHPESESSSEMAGFINLAAAKPVYATVEGKRTQDDALSQADSIASATAGFNFLDNLDASTPTHERSRALATTHRTSTPSPPATPKSTRSDISDSSGAGEGFYSVNSLNSTFNTSKGSDSSGTRDGREGMYEVNPLPNHQLESATIHQLDQPASGNYDYPSDSLRRRALGLPPLFNAPPPPSDPPPSEGDVGDMNEWVAEGSSIHLHPHNDSHNSSGTSASSVSVVRYTTNQQDSKPASSNQREMGASYEVTLNNDVVYEKRGVSSERVDSFFTSSKDHLPEFNPDSYHKPEYLSKGSADHAQQRYLRVCLDKKHKSLGISISGGSDSKNQPDIKINGIFPGGAATHEGTLKPGMRLISIDGQDMSAASHQEAVDVIRRSYSNKSNMAMKWIVAPLEESSAF